MELYFDCCGKRIGGTIEESGRFDFTCASCDRQYTGRLCKNGISDQEKRGRILGMMLNYASEKLTLRETKDKIEKCMKFLNEC